MTEDKAQDQSKDRRYGIASVELVKRLFDRDINRVVLLMRHSAREYDPDINDLLNPLTDEGRAYSREFGKQLPKDVFVKGYASPPERCVETGELVVDPSLRLGGTVEAVLGRVLKGWVLVT